MTRFSAILIPFVFLLLLNDSRAGISVEPPFWWTGMKDRSLQLMLHGEGLSKVQARISGSGMVLRKVHEADYDYLFLDLEVAANAKPGIYAIEISREGKLLTTVSYELRQRQQGSASRKGFDTDDVFYMIMPDRFSNGDPSNDNLPGMLEQADRNDPNGRHGGDLKGIRDHLDYIRGLGVTAILINPLLENNMPKYSYHGCAITDFYKVDPRFGSNRDYLEMVKETHGKGMKAIMGMVFNHYGTSHTWHKAPPFDDWTNNWPGFTPSNYRAGVNTDPHASGYDRKQMSDGWIDVSMADLNQKNPFVAGYLIQNSIWWTEYAGLDGICTDYYTYNDKDFMTRWMKRMLVEYPGLNIVGEAWMNTPPQIAWWEDLSPKKNNDRTFLTNVFDFPLTYAIQQAFIEKEGWSSGLPRLYEILSQDFVYPDPTKLVTLADNHKLDRMAAVLQSPGNVMLALAFLFTTRGIPLIYYGTEILMQGWKNEGEGSIRKDMPGGWPGDSISAFSGSGLDNAQLEVMQHIRVILHWRMQNNSVRLGRLTHYIPENDMYVYFRTYRDESVMVILNNSKDTQKLYTDKYTENLMPFRSGKDITNNTMVTDLSAITIPGKSARIIELKK